MPMVDDNIRACAGTSQREDFPDPSRPTRNQNRFSIQRFVHFEDCITRTSSHAMCSLLDIFCRILDLYF
jgi:hypothetical protein